MKQTLFLITFLTASALPTFAVAATLSFTTDQVAAGVGYPITVEVLLLAERAINAIETTVVIPPGLELVDTSDGNSIITVWVERPQYDRGVNTLTFAGIIPNGFSGTGKLLTLTLTANAAAQYTLSFDPARTTLYQNGPNGARELATLTERTLRVESGVGGGLTPRIDTDLPEAFAPVAVRDPQLYDGAWMLVFATQDKGSGIAYYEVSESLIRRLDTSALGWKKAESPYQLLDQTRGSYTYVRAVDKQGNIRVALYTPLYGLSWLEYSLLGILGGILLLSVYWLRRRNRHYVLP